jgi:glycosyltransferase involved in cell wall biosynthesis
MRLKQIVNQDFEDYLKYSDEDILFSIIVPIYNTEKYLGKCIYSVLEQTYYNFEVILIDDGSTDQSYRICNRYAKLDNRIKVFKQPHQGVVIARRNAVAKAKGNYILFLDSDDYWDSNLLEKVHKAIIDFGCDMVVFNYKKAVANSMYYNKPVFEDGTLFDKENKKLIFEQIIQGSSLNSLCTKAVKSSLIDYEDYSRYKDIKHADDLLQSLPLLYLANKILYIDEPLYNYRIHSESVTHTFDIRSIKDITRVRKIVLKYMDLLDMNQNEYLVLFYRFYMKSVLSYLSELCNSSLSLAKKCKMMGLIKTIPLYKNAIPYLESKDFPFREKLQVYLYYKGRYIKLILYYKAVRLAKAIYDR